jgi:hypothetical protein
MKIPAAVAFVAFLAGCAAYGGSGLPPGAPEAQVRAAMGAPALEFSNPDGSRRLVYPRGPLGTQTFMADIDRNGKLESVTPVLSDDAFYHVKPGMTRDDVLRTIGPPGETMHFARTNQDAWDYRYQDTWGYVAIFSVNLDATTGVVVSTFKRRIERDRGR